MDSLMLDFETRLVPIYAALTACVICASVFSFRQKVEPMHGDLQSPKTYAYGSVRQYPTATWMQYFEELFFMAYYWWVAVARNGYKTYESVLYGENLVQTFLIPGLNQRPRILLSPLRAHGTALDIEWMGDWTKATKTVDIINAASFDYGGFGLFLHNEADVCTTALQTLPYMERHGTELVHDAAETETAAFLGFEHGHFVTSGYTMNLVSFPAMHAAAAQKHLSTVFLMDSSSHNSMMVGSYISSGSRIIRFQHNNVLDLEAKLKTLSTEQNLEIIVGLEGNYSMEGGLPPLPAVIALKQTYRFKIFIDEAHSFLALGHTGRGIVEHYQDAGFPISSKDVDCIGATMSKSVGAIGGILVVHDPAWSRAIQSRMADMHRSGGSGDLPIVVKVRLLQILRKPTLVRKRMSILRQHTVYILESLHKAGLCVHSDYMSPVIVVITISLSGCARFGAECHRLGLALTVAGPPATDAWRSVGRLCINALLSKEDVENLVRIVVKAAVNIGNVKASAYTIVKGIEYSTFDDNARFDAAIKTESERVDRDMLQLIHSQVRANGTQSLGRLDSKVLEYGAQILQTQGLGATSNRLYWGSLVPHVQCEQKLATMCASLALQVGEPGALIMTDARNAVSSTLAACMSPLADKSALHLVFIPISASLPVREAIKSVKVTKKVQVVFYATLADIAHAIDGSASARVHVTLYSATCDAQGQQPLDLSALTHSLLAARAWSRKVSGMQLLLDDTYGFGTMGPRKLGYLDLLESQYGEKYFSTSLSVLRKPIRLFIMGSFYEAFKLQGGFVLTTKQMVKVLQWTSRASMFV